MSWNDQRIDTLKRLWTDGLSASQIAASLGYVTRNAVIGKIHRLGLSGRSRTGQPSIGGKPRKERPVPRRSTRPTVAAIGNGAMATAEPSYAVMPRREPEPEASTEVMSIGQRVDIMMLTEKTCRWPIGDPGMEGFTFCGRKPCAGTPYCTSHARIAYMPAERRARHPRKESA